jgi:hypothetical protein
MNVTLMGPDELGFWFLVDENANSFPFIERHEDHPAAAAQLGWEAPVGVTDNEDLISIAIDFLTANTGEDFTAPQHVVEFFRRMEADNEG